MILVTLASAALLHVAGGGPALSAEKVHVACLVKAAATRVDDHYAEVLVIAAATETDCRAPLQVCDSKGALPSTLPPARGSWTLYPPLTICLERTDVWGGARSGPSN